MAKKFASLITEKGKTLIAAAIAGGDTIKLKYFAVGDGNGAAVTPTSDQTALVNEVARVEINSLKETDATKQIVTAEAIIPAATGGFWMREAGVFTEDGTLLAASQMPETYKPDTDDGAASTQTVRMLLAVSDTSTVNLTIDDTTVIASEDYVNSQLAAHEKSRNHPDGTLTEKGFVQLSSATDSDCETLAATPKAVKAANDNADSRLSADKNLEDLNDAGKSRDNLGLGDLATKDTLTASDVGAFPAVGGAVGSKGVSSPFLFAGGDSAPLDNQGGWIEWNRSNGLGELNLICNRGSGEGGHEFITVTGDGKTITARAVIKADRLEIFQISPGGNSGDVNYAPSIMSTIPGRGAQDFSEGATALFRMVEQVGTLAYAEIICDGFGAARSFQFDQNGKFHAPSNVHAGDAFMATDGNVYGSCWDGYLNNWIASRISTSSISGLRLSAATWTGAIGNDQYNFGDGNVITGVQSGANYAINMIFAYRQLQVCINGNWVAVSSL